MTSSPLQLSTHAPLAASTPSHSDYVTAHMAMAELTKACEEKENEKHELRRELTEVYGMLLVIITYLSYVHVD